MIFAKENYIVFLKPVGVCNGSLINGSVINHKNKTPERFAV